MFKGSGEVISLLGVKRRFADNGGLILISTDSKKCTVVENNSLKCSMLLKHLSFNFYVI